MSTEKDDLAELQADFFRIYANVPVNIRDEIVVVIDGKPLTWNVVFIEVNSMTALSENILRTLRTLSII